MSQLTTTQPTFDERTTGLGGHDIGAICGVHPFLTALDVYNEKVNGVSHFDPQYIQKRGLYLEKFLLEEYLKDSPNSGVSEGKFYRHVNYPFFYAHPDYVLTRPNMGAGGQVMSFGVSDDIVTKIIECKAPAAVGKEWGEEGTFEVPDYIKCQAAWYCMVVGCRRLDIIVDSPFKLKVYSYERDPYLEAELFSAGLDFWNNHVLAKIPPEPQTAADVGELYRKSDPDTTIEADEELGSMIFRIKELQGHIKNFNREADSLKTEVQKRMKKNETVALHGVELATWKPSAVTRLDVKSIKEECPDLYEDYTVTTTARRFLVK